MSRNRLNAVLIENNPYDSAVIDAALQSDSEIVLRYTNPHSAMPLDLDPDAWKDCFNGDKPNVALLDLALSATCEEQIPSAQFQDELRNSKGVLPAVCVHLERAQREMDALVRATYFLCRASESGGAARNLSLVGLSGLMLSGDPGRSCEAVVKTLNETGTVPESLLDTALVTLWDGASNAALARIISRAPSLWRILVAIARNPDVCFFVVSHYANPAIADPLMDLLGSRHVAPATDPDFYLEFIINKSDLSDLGAKLQRGYTKWQSLSLSAVLDPFSVLPITLPSRKEITFREMIAMWEHDHLTQRSLPPETILWDETGTVNKGTERWEAIVRRWANSPVVLDALPAAQLIAVEKDILIVESHDFLNGIESNKWAVTLGEILAQRRAKGLETLIVVGGTDSARGAAFKVLQGATHYQVPPFHSWKSLKSLVIGLGVLGEKARPRVLRWSDSPRFVAADSLEGRLLADAKAATNQIVDRIVARLVRDSKKDGVNALTEVLLSLESLLAELHVTAETEQNVGKMCDRWQFPEKGFWNF